MFLILSGERISDKEYQNFLNIVNKMEIKTIKDSQFALKMRCFVLS